MRYPVTDEMTVPLSQEFVQQILDVLQKFLEWVPILLKFCDFSFGFSIQNWQILRRLVKSKWYTYWFFPSNLKCFLSYALDPVQVILFEIDWAIFYTNVRELFFQFICWTNWVNSCKFMDDCWISCQVMADMKKNLWKSHNY